MATIHKRLGWRLIVMLLAVLLTGRLKVIELELPFPPSVNGYWRSFKGRQIISEKGRDYRKHGLVLIGKRDPVAGPLSVTVELMPPDRRRRDCDNYIKALFDLMTHAGVWMDDSQVKRLLVIMSDELSGRVKVSVSPLVG